MLGCERARGTHDITSSERKNFAAKTRAEVITSSFSSPLLSSPLSLSLIAIHFSLVHRKELIEMTPILLYKCVTRP